MKKILLLCGMLLALCATVASAAPGVNLGWNNCVGGGGVHSKTFACDTNAGDQFMVSSVKAPAGVTLWTSFETYIDFQSNSTPLPLWWQLRNQTGQTNQCRNGALTASVDFTAAPYLGACLDSYQGAGTAGVSNYTLNGTNRASLKLTCSVPSANQVPLEADGEYFTARVRVTNVKTIGTGSCAGCQDGVCINITSIRVLQPAGTPGGNTTVTAEALSSYIMWNNPSVEACHGATPTKSSTWGSVKALYR